MPCLFSLAGQLLHLQRIQSRVLHRREPEVAQEVRQEGHHHGAPVPRTDRPTHPFVQNRYVNPWTLIAINNYHVGVI